MANDSGYFGRDPDSFNIEDPEDRDGSDLSDGSGRPGINIAANAISFWIGQQCRDVTIGEIAEAFKMPPAAVAEACETHYWLHIGVTDEAMAEWVVGQDGE